MTTEVRAVCSHDCPDACALLVTVDGGRAVNVAPNPAHPVTGRHLCVKVDRYLERVYSPERLLTPLRRRGTKGAADFVPIGWDEALDTIVGRWRAIVAAEGAAAILPYSYLGSMGVLSALGTMHALFHRLGATRLERTICGGQDAGLRALVGAAFTDPENLDGARLVIAWGIDLVSTSIHTWDIVNRARARGARLVVVDPYRSRTAAQADVHVRLHAGTDGALALGLLHVIFRERLEDTDYLERYASGVTELRAAVAEWTPERTAAVTGVAPATIVELAREYATTKPAGVRHGVGMQRAAGAGMALRAIHCLPVVAGQWRHAAGGIADARTLRLSRLDRLMRPDLGPAAPRTVNMIQLGRVLTDPGLTPPVRALYVWNSNPAIIAADQGRVLRGLGREDLFTVVHEQFLTDTARHADIVLPATTMLEQQDLLGSWGFNYMAVSPPAIAPRGEAKSNSEVARVLAARLGFDDDVFRLSDSELIDLALGESTAEAAGATRARLDAEGFAYIGPGKGKPVYAQGGFPTPSGRFEFVSADLARAGHGPLPVYIPPAESPDTDVALAARFPLRLLTRKRHHSINSSYGGLPVLLRAEPEPELELHPADAGARGIADGQAVRVWNDRGGVTFRARLTERVPAGTVAAPFGNWMREGGSANALTSDRLGDLGHGPTFCDALVEVAACGAAAPVAASRVL
ncbi:MAG TPA: molybdopterin-dependent oxidoreductase [Candidatus Limnocylindria bacterium]|nr:molybdopterin-dependent oxidoreductase [Candidatus Limnocylindria bacterium]